MHILLVNDDGFDSPSLHALCSAAARRGHRVTVVAPHSQQSAKSQSLTVFDPLRIIPGEMEGAEAAWRVIGTPGDCTRLGTRALNVGPVDLVISGINDGYNAGLDTYVSGTVGAAREAAFIGIRAMAVSTDWTATAETVAFTADYAIRTAERLMVYDAPKQSVCNLNVPPLPRAELKPTVMAPLSHDQGHDTYERRVSPRGETYFWLGPWAPADEFEPGCDHWYLRQGHPTVTFLTVSPFDQGQFADFPVEV